jgi:formate dehydrogenase iron-sulfur subunit
MAAIGAFAAIGFLHHLISGPNRVSDADEQNAERLTGDGT